MSSASPSPHPGVDPLCSRATPTRTEGGRPLCFSIRQATAGHGKMSVRLNLAKTQLSSMLPVCQCCVVRLREVRFQTKVNAFKRTSADKRKQVLDSLYQILYF